jgi:hypothetical protein
MALTHFLLIFDVMQDELVSAEEFSSAHEAALAYTEAERRYRDRDDHEKFEIVLIGADSLSTVQVTHSRYFRRSEEAVPF